jgi:hypothetical protein
MKLAALGFAVLLAAGSAFADDLDTAFQNLKQAEAQKDNAKLKEAAVATYALANKVIATPAPAAADDKPAWDAAVANAKGVQAYVEYALLTASGTAAPASAADLLTTLAQLNPKSTYLEQNYGFYLEAMRKSGAPAAQIQTAAENGVAAFPANEDLLLWLADAAYTHKQADRCVAYSKRLIASLNTRAKPENLSAADWERKRTAALGHGYFLAGSSLNEQHQYLDADKMLRLALPLAAGNDALRAQVLYLLGVANYQLGTMTNNKAMVLEAVKFSKQAADIPGPMQQNAKRNAYAMDQQSYKMH